MSKFTSTSEAYQIARERARVAASFQANLFYVAVHDARAAGMSIREAAAVLHASKSTVARYWHEVRGCSRERPLWGSEHAWRDAHAAGWAHTPGEFADDFVP